MFEVAFDPEAQKDFLKLPQAIQIFIAKKILELKEGHFGNDKALKGKHKGKFRKRVGDYRIVYLKEGKLLLVTIIRIAHRKEVYL